MEAVAVSLLFSFLNPEHERRLGARLRAALPGVPIYLSSRGAAGDQGVRAHQHDRGVRLRRADPGLLSGAAGERHARARACRALYVMGSNGGILEAAEAVAMPAMAVESGPAAGVVAAALVARQTGRPICSPSTWAAPPPRPA